MIETKKAEVGYKENILMAKINDDSIVPELRDCIKNNKPFTHLIQSGQITEVFEKQNLIVDAGLNVIARLLAGDTTYSGEIKFGALGTGSTAVNALDTQLENEVFRKAVSSSSFDGKIAYVDIFYEKADVAGTFTRFANFIDGSITFNSGIMWSHLPVNWIKTLNDGLFVACRYTASYKA